MLLAGHSTWPVQNPAAGGIFLNSANQSRVGDTAMSVLNSIFLPCLLNLTQWIYFWDKTVYSKSLKWILVVDETWADLWFLWVQALHVPFCLPGRTSFPQGIESRVYHDCTLWCSFFCLLVVFMADASSPWHCQFDQLATEQWGPEGYGFLLEMWNWPWEFWLWISSAMVLVLFCCEQEILLLWEDTAWAKVPLPCFARPLCGLAWYWTVHREHPPLVL